MELLLLVKLIEKLDDLTQKSIGRVIGDFERFLADPAGYLANGPIIIGPRRRYFSRGMRALVIGYLGAILTALVIVVVMDVAGIQPALWPTARGLVLLGLFGPFFFGIFRWLRGGRCVVSATGA